MPNMITTIGRGLVPVQVEYDTDVDYDDEGTAHIDIEIIEVLNLKTRADEKEIITESVFQSLESDCRAHEIAEARKERMEYSGDTDKLAALAHYTRQAELAGAL